MIRLLQVALDVLRGIKAAWQHRSRLDELRNRNPGCTILSSDISESRMGKAVAVLENARLKQVCMGNHSYVSEGVVLVNTEIGNFCSIGRRVVIGLGTHPSRTFVSTYPAFYRDGNAGCPVSFRKDRIFDDSVPLTRIGHDVWIGSHAIIPGGINIGTGAIVAAGSVVVKDVPPYAVVGGNPASVIRYRFTEEQIGLLLASEWWDWPTEEIVRNVDLFSDITEFTARAR